MAAILFLSYSYLFLIVVFITRHRLSRLGCVAGSSGYLVGISTEEVPIQHIQQNRIPTYAPQFRWHSPEQWMCFHHCFGRPEHFFCALEQEFLEFPKFRSRVNNLAYGHGPVWSNRAGLFLALSNNIICRCRDLTHLKKRPWPPWFGRFRLVDEQNESKIGIIPTYGKSASMKVLRIMTRNWTLVGSGWWGVKIMEADHLDYLLVHSVLGATNL